jgi:hypothetical protein
LPRNSFFAHEGASVTQTVLKKRTQHKSRQARDNLQEAVSPGFRVFIGEHKLHFTGQAPRSFKNLCGIERFNFLAIIMCPWIKTFGQVGCCINICKNGFLLIHVELILASVSIEEGHSNNETHQ